MGCATNVVKYLFFAFNLVFWILGIVVFAIGIYSRVENDSWKQLVIDSTTFSEAANLLIASGVIVAVIGFFGCCGAIKKCQWMLIGYSALILLIFILQLSAGIYAYTKKDTIQKTLGDKINKVVLNSFGKKDTKLNVQLTKAINWLQNNVKCCGSHGPKDWANSEWAKLEKASKKLGDPMLVPDSCCVVNKMACGASKKTLASLISGNVIHKEGCLKKGKEFAKSNIYLVGGVGVAIAIIQLLGVVFALCLCKSFRDEDKGATA